MLEWRTITPCTSPLFMRKGTELSCAVVPNTLHRFVICEVRTIARVGEGLEYDRQYCVRDAAHCTDADIRAGKRAPIVASFDCDSKALEYCFA